MTSKNDEIITAYLDELLARARKFDDAVKHTDLLDMVTLFIESQSECLSLIADICEDPASKVKIMEGVLSSKNMLDAAKDI